MQTFSSYISVGNNSDQTVSQITIKVILKTPFRGSRGHQAHFMLVLSPHWLSCHPRGSLQPKPHLPHGMLKPAVGAGGAAD